jgi:predicted PolB exonuclease-like 3'-5' exonuclease
MEYYFDMETTGRDYDNDEIITIQWQRLGFAGEPIGKLNILKRWDSSEKEILENFIPKLTCYRWDFVFIGKNLLFDFNMLSQRMKYFNLGEFDLRCFDERVILDITPILVLMNNGNFRDYDKVIPKTNPIENKEIPKFFREGKYPEIIQYINDEARDFIKAYQTLRKEMPSLIKNL